MDLPVLKYVDVLIGVSLVMLLVATVALSISQTLMNMSSSRSRHLQAALKGLIQQIHPTLLQPHAELMARLVLLHPLVGLPRGPLGDFRDYLKRILRRVPWLGAFFSPGPRYSGRVILREELAMCLLQWASDEGAWSMGLDPEDREPAAAARTALVQTLRERGIEDPTATLSAVKLQAMANERDNPDQAAEVWRSQALAQCAPSDFLAGLYQTFDNAMARATTAFGKEAQVWVSVVAFVLVFAAQLDVFQLVKRLSVDETYRNALVKQADELNKQLETSCGATSCDATKLNEVVLAAKGVDCSALKADSPERARCEIAQPLAILREPSLDIWPEAKPGKDGVKPASRSERFATWLGADNELAQKWPGIIVAWLLVSLGAPFWYDLLKNLFKLRSLLAQKDDADRTERNAGAKPPTATVNVNKPGDSGGSGAGVTPPAPPAAPPAGGVASPDDHMGDLAATGANG